MMVEAGLDGVEILSSMGYLVSQFLNPRTNVREDEFGGTFGNRLRLLREIIASIRKKIGPQFTVGIRISADEMDPKALSASEVLQIVAALDVDGGLDYINAISGTAASYRGQKYIVPDMAVPAAFMGPFAKRVKEVVSLPVLTAGRVTQPQDAERMIANGDADMIGIVRENIADPQYVNKARAGRAEDIRACIGCNQACIGHGNRGFSVSCIQFPESGREVKYGNKTKVASPKKVVVVGGGPGGMKAAIVAAERGHDVTLYEKGKQLGGQVLLAQLLPGRAEFGGLATNLTHELKVHGVSVKTGIDVTPELIKSIAPDKLIIATGATPQMPAIEGLEDGPIVDCWSVIRGEANVGQSVVIWDWGCDWVGMGVALILAQQGCKVRLAVNGIAAGERIPRMVRDNLVGELHKLDVEVIPYVRLEGIDADTAYFEHVTSGQVVTFNMDTLVSNHARRRNASLADSLRGTVKEMTLIGDCLAPRTAEEAVFEGLKAAMAV
jgi:NADPH-dependent 2,4-dienoyl-CoA reductase/sulfur reductase-like enzyme